MEEAEETEDGAASIHLVWAMVVTQTNNVENLRGSSRPQQNGVDQCARSAKDLGYGRRSTRAAKDLNATEFEAKVMHVKEGEIVKWASGTYEMILSVWLLDSGADVHVMTIDEWERLGKPGIIESDVVLKTASGEVEFEAILATKVQRCLLSGIKLRESGYSVVIKGDGSYIEKDEQRLHLSRDGKRDVVNFTI